MLSADVSDLHTQSINTHDISLSSNSYQAVDMLADRYQYFARHVTAFLGTRRLILDMDSCRPVLDEELGKLHNCRETAMASICIRYYRSEEISVGDTSSFRFWG